MNNVSATWDENSSRKTLNQIDLKIKPGQLCAIIGPVGGGKVNELFFCSIFRFGYAI